MTLAESLYLPGIVSGMAITLKHLFRRKTTIRYPEEDRRFSEIYRGKHVLKRDDEGREGVLPADCALLPVRQKQLQW